jgi:hypothetical protein
MAHDLEDPCEAPKTQPKKKRGKPQQESVEASERWFDSD